MANYTPLGFDADNGQADVLGTGDTLTNAGGIISTPIGQSGTAEDAKVDDLEAATAKVTNLNLNQVVFSVDAAGTLTGHNNLQWDGSILAITGALTGTTTADFGTSVTVGAGDDMVISVGSITSVSGAISFGNENLTTTGDFAAKDGDFSGNLTVVGDIISGGATDVLISDKFIDLAFVDTASNTVANAGGFTISQNRLDGFTAGQVATFTANSGSGAEFTYSGNGDTQGTALAAGDVIAITGSEEGGNNGLFIVASVSGTINVGVGQTVEIRSNGSTDGVPPGACPWAQNAFATAASQTGVAMKVDLSVVCITDGSANFKTTAGGTIPKGAFVTSTNGIETSILGSVVGNWTANGAYASVEADVSVQEAYDGQSPSPGTPSILTTNALGSLSITCDTNTSGFTINGDDAAGIGDVSFGKATGGTTAHPINSFEVTTGAAVAITAGSTLDLSATTSMDLSATTTVTLDAGGTNALSIGCDAAGGNTGAINIGTNGQARAITVGNAASASLSLEAGAGALTMAADQHSSFTVAGSAQTLDIDATGVLSLNSSAGVINIGDDNVSQAINIGNHASSNRAIGIGAGSAGSVNIDGGAVNLGTDATAATTITIGESGGNANTIVLDAGISTVAINGQGALSIGNDNDPGALSLGTGGGRAIGVGSAVATGITMDSILLSIDSTDTSNLTMTVDVDGGVRTLTIEADNTGTGAGTGAHLTMIAKTDATVLAANGAVVLQQGQLNAKAGGVTIGRVLGVTAGALTCEEVSSTTTTSFQLYGICAGNTGAGNSVPTHSFPGGITEMDVDNLQSTPAIGDVLYLTTNGRVTPDLPAAPAVIFRVGIALAATTGLTAAVYAPQYIMNLNA